MKILLVCLFLIMVCFTGVIVKALIDYIKRK